MGGSPSKYPHHITHRGNHHRETFFSKDDYNVMKEPATRIMALDRGDMNAVPVLPYQQIDDLKKRKDIRVVTGAGSQRTLVYVLRQLQSPLPFQIEISDLVFRGQHT